MTVIHTLKISEDYLENIYDVLDTAKRPDKKKGIKLLFLKILIGRSGQDFFDSTYTINIYYNAYKKPRIIKN